MFREFTLGEIIEMLNGTTEMSVQELVRGVSIDSRTTKPGDLFFALQGSRTDGHEFVADALGNGALAAVVQRGNISLRGIRVEDTLFALGELARNYRGQFSIKTIGITGTNGKTTVKNLVAAVLKSCSKVVSTSKNYNSLIGLPLTVFRVSGDEDYLVLEMGTNAPGEIKRLCDIAIPDVGLITNVGPGHLAGLDSIEGIQQEKLSLIKALPENGIGLVGEGVDVPVRSNITRLSTELLDRVEITEHGSHFTVDDKPYFTRLLGTSNVYNCLAAICLTSKLGIAYEMQHAAIAEVGPEPGRMEPIWIEDLLIIDDTYNANPVSMKAAMDFAAQSARRKVFVLGDMLELGVGSETLHRDVGAYAQQCADLLLTYGKEAGLYGGRHFAEQVELVRYLTECLRGDEIVLVKASRALRFENVVSRLTRLLR
ncbi:MAG: UDP-N-acetylmuramoyl-tripeptide--D-alanyl-D-alanine ligase [candidate division WOR-3 bacterium]|jgi:UDP-N-acetylmuramoyl-tripeptide--D-alanyl-D-alanine ligase